MQALKTQIKESFFNPILSFLPIIVFVVADDFKDLDLAWKLSLPLAIISISYIYFFYQRLFLWNGFLSLSYLLIGISTSICYPYINNVFIAKYFDEICFIILLLPLLFAPSEFEKIGNKTLPHSIPLTNNMCELRRVTILLIAVLGGYVALNALIYNNIMPIENKNAVNMLYLLCLSVVVAYETIRVFIVRNKLYNEDWMPIMDRDGKVIGSCQYQDCECSYTKHIHPVVRCYFIDNGTILLSKRRHDDNTDPLLWDATISKHVRVGESIERSLKNTVKQYYNTQLDRFMFLSNYLYEGNFDNQYIYLFACCKKSINPQYDNFESIKWWTAKQIEDNVNNGIFSKRFVEEFKVLERSGLLEPNRCECSCTIKDQMFKVL